VHAIPVPGVFAVFQEVEDVLVVRQNDLPPRACRLFLCAFSLFLYGGAVSEEKGPAVEFACIIVAFTVHKSIVLESHGWAILCEKSRRKRLDDRLSIVSES